MGIVIDIVSVLTIICLLGAMLYATKAFKAKEDKQYKKQSVQKAGIFFLGYCLLNVLRLMMENNLI